MKDKKTTISTVLGLLSGGGSLLFGTCTTACAAGGAALCATPLLSLTGLGTAAFAQVSWLKYLLIPISMLCFALAFYRQYRKPPCDRNAPDCNCKPKTNSRHMKATLWLSFILSLFFMSWTVFKGNGHVNPSTPSLKDTAARCSQECAQPCAAGKDSIPSKKTACDQAEPCQTSDG